VLWPCFAKGSQLLPAIQAKMKDALLRRGIPQTYEYFWSDFTSITKWSPLFEAKLK
jgi:hypothetical protein